MNVRTIFKNGVRILANQFIRANTKSDFFMVINVLDEVANEIRGRANALALNKATLGLTFDEWRSRGYHVLRGQRHTGRRQDGVCTFEPHQVAPIGGYTGNGRKYPGPFFREQNQIDFGDDFADDDIPF